MNSNRHSQRGQATVEYLLLISVVVIGLAAVLLGFTDTFGPAVGRLSGEMASCTLVSQGVQTGSSGGGPCD